MGARSKWRIPQLSSFDFNRVPRINSGDRGLMIHIDTLEENGVPVIQKQKISGMVMTLASITMR